jgi:hypothetical protein
MSVTGSGKPGPVPGRPEETFVTLEPLRKNGPDALDRAGIPEIANTRLRGLEITAENAFHEVNSHEADDLFRCAAAEDKPAIPATGTITAATFEFEFTDSPQPRRVIVRVPDIITLERPEDAPLILRWLEKHGFCIQRKLSCLLLFLGLSLVVATANPLVEDDADDDDPEDNEQPAISFTM